MDRLLQNLPGRHQTVVLLASCGVIGPVLFLTSVGIVNFFCPGPGPVGQLVSDLGRGSTTDASLMNHGDFIMLGIFTLLFGVALYLAAAPRGLALAGAVCMSLGGLGMIGVGVFSNEPSSEMVDNSAMLHQNPSSLL